MAQVRLPCRLINKRFFFQLYIWRCDMKKVIIILAALLCVSNLNAQTECVTPPSGLISWWPGNGNANDSVGSNPGTLQNGATFAPSLVGQAFSFDGEDDYIRVADSDNLRPSQLTVEAWVKSSVIPSMHYFIVAKSDQDAYHGYELGVTSAAQRPGEGRGRFLVLGSSNTNYGDAIGSTYLLDGNFHHIAGTYDGSALKLYVDGKLETLTTWSGPITYTTHDLFIGTRQNSYGDVFKGVIDEVSLYNRALSDQEIAGIYNARNAGKCKPTVSVEEKKTKRSRPILAYAKLPQPVQPLNHDSLRAAARQPG